MHARLWATVCAQAITMVLFTHCALPTSPNMHALVKRDFGRYENCEFFRGPDDFFHVICEYHGHGHGQPHFVTPLGSEGLNWTLVGEVTRTPHWSPRQYTTGACQATPPTFASSLQGLQRSVLGQEPLRLAFTHSIGNKCARASDDEWLCYSGVCVVRAR